MYYRLTYRTPAGPRKTGDSILCAKRTLDIGQTAGCEARLAESEVYEPQLCATIAPFDDYRGWYLVRRSDYARITIDGQEIDTAAILKNSQLLKIETGNIVGEFKFEILTDANYDDQSGIILCEKKKNVRTRAIILAATILVALGLAATAGIKTHWSDIRSVDFDSYAASVMQIVTDSIFLTRETISDGGVVEEVLEAVELREPRCGTCFLTAEGQLVTARHCIEPWIDDTSWDTLQPPARMAAVAEAHRHDPQPLSVWASCKIRLGDEEYRFRSTDFHIDTSRDLLFPIGGDDGDDVLYRRSIVPIGGRRDMELGDVAYLDWRGRRGGFRLATLEELERFDKQRGKGVAALGFPRNDNNALSLMKVTFGNSQHLEFASHGGVAGCIEMAGDINPGNSGGPVLARVRGRVRVVGIVSKSDLIATQGVFWAVPATEIKNIIDKNQTQEGKRCQR